MSITLANFIEDTVVAKFPTELKDIYFIKDSINKTPKGKIYSKYFNTIKQLQNHGLVDKKIYQSTETNLPTNRSSSSFDKMIEIEDVSIYISQLHHEVLTWPEIETIWLKTTNYRLKNIKEEENIFLHWKHFKEPMGYRLANVLKEKIKDPSSKKQLDEMLKTAHLTESK
ncbi:uncharacterized protein LOC132938834 [Metopolophium dirhodum]|uniref:uncharacterized protein LOC132938834 n=1 Tax=Metopolophium dirhodum TaxID=44670 RepID=UPI00298F9783|nr:uncharacterized protein LOC132938834 [Metopolophium dirhodum]